MKDKYLKLYSYNIPVKGKDKCAIYSLQKGKVYLIPDSLYYLIQELDDRSYPEVRESFLHDIACFDENIDFLLNNHLAFWTYQPHCFPKMDISFQVPEMISSVIIDFNHKLSYRNALKEFNDCNAKVLEIRTNPLLNTIDSTVAFLEDLDNSTFRSIHLYFTEALVDAVEKLLAISSRYRKLSFITVLNSENNFTLFNDNCRISFVGGTAGDIRTTDSIYCKYLVDQNYFMETYFHNPLYNKSVAIDFNGNIMNCLGHRSYFGNIAKDSITQISLTKRFQKIWKHASKNRKNTFATFYCSLEFYNNRILDQN